MRSIVAPRARFVGLVLVLLGGSSCLEERAPISRLQPNAMEKTFFIGTDPSNQPEFYMRTTVVDVDSGAGNDGLFTASDAQPVARIRWEIAEKLLLARLTYERVEDTDYRGVRRVNSGQAVAAFTIERHFDIKRDYNPTTGEALNVVVENETDRPWQERSFMRVDWSRNLITDAYELDTLSQLGIYYGVKWSPVAYYVSDPRHADAPQFDIAGSYFDITHKAMASPEIIRDPEWGDFPSCWLIGRFPLDNCNPSELTLRVSFKKVEDTDYEPIDWDGTRMDMFGLFTMDRFGYDRRYGITDNRWHRFAARWNIWEKSHAAPVVACNTKETTPVGKSSHRDENQNGTEDECESVGRGSRCDEFRGECTVPIRDRKVKTIAWHVNPGFPDDLFEGTQRALDSFSDSIRVGVVAGRVAECRRTGETDCEGAHGWPSRWSDDFTPPLGTNGGAQVPKVFVLCHNPVDRAKGDDVTVCGTHGTSPRLGDLRYNIISMIQEPQQMSPWGIMMDAEDPLTGEKISGSVNQWGATLDRAASSLVDMLGLLNGEIRPTDFVAGIDVSDWIAQRRATPGGAFSRSLDAAEVASRLSALEPRTLERYTTGGATARTRNPKARRRARARALVDSGRLGAGNASLSQRMRALRNTAVEAKLVSPDLVQAVGVDPTTPPTATTIRRASPFGKMLPAERRADARSKRMARARRHSCRLEAAEPDNLLGMAKAALRLFPSPDPSDAAAVTEHRTRVWNWARQQFSMGVMAHEIGHSVGLRHNFAGSFDSLNYANEYWQLRTRNGEVTAPCVDGQTDGATCVGPRWKDPLTQDEIDNSIGRYATTSVMDYPGDATHDMLLPGKYDRAAMRLVYGGTLDVWNTPGVSVKGTGEAKQKAYTLSAFTVSPGLFGVYDFPPVNTEDPYISIHYSRYQQEFGLLGECAASSEPAAILGKKCNGAPLDIVDYRDMKDFASDPDYAQFAWALSPRAVDPSGRVRRGYMFSSDEFADTGNVPSFSYDAGADAYEQIRFLESQYEHRYLLDGFRRNRVQFNSWDQVARMQSHYLDNIQLIAKAFAFGAILDGNPAAPSDDFKRDGSYGPLLMGATVALDLFARMLTRPEPGYYCSAEICGSGQPTGVERELFSADPVPQPDLYTYDFRVPFGDGRYLHNDFDYSQGYWWADYQTQVGAYYEKIWSTYYLAEAFDEFISNSKEDFTDGRYKNVSFATVFPEQVRRLYTSLMTGDSETYAPYVVVPDSPDETPDGVLQYPAWHDPASLGVRPPNAKIVDPNYGWNVQLYAMVWGSMFFPSNWSQQWIDEARITVTQAEQVEWPANEVYTLRDPVSGLVYRAHSTGTELINGKARQRSMGARMLEWGDRLLEQAYLVERDPGGLPLRNTDGTLQVRYDGSRRPLLNPEKPAAAAAFQKHVDTVDILNQITTLFERGLSDTDLPNP